MSRNPLGLEIEPINLGFDGHRIQKKSCPATIRDQLRVKYWKGKYAGNCFCCGRKISWEHVEAGRIKAGGDYSVQNTRLICKTCNRGMGRQNLKIYMKKNFPDRYKKYFPKDTTKKPDKRKRKASGGDYWVNPITGRKEKTGFSLLQIP